MNPPNERQWQRVARAASQNNDTSVAYETHFTHGAFSMARFRLSNGMRVLLMPDHRAPIFAYQSWFAVGSRDEHPEHTGLAHFLEHLMFKGTTQHEAGDFDREMERRGAQTNAATWVDWTYYTQALAAKDDNLETVIHFEADRMRSLVLDESTFLSELEVVKNERRMSVENSVYGLMSERLFQLAFTQHPYRWPTLGWMEHLEKCSLENVRAFYRANYAPNNAVVVLVGDIDPYDALTQIVRDYGGLSSEPVQRKLLTQEAAQREARTSTFTYATEVPHLTLAFHTPQEDSPDFMALEFIMDALVSGDSARLYRRLVAKEALASSVEGFLTPFAHPGLCEFVVTGRAGMSHHRLAEIVQEELDSCVRGMNQREFIKARNSLELAFYESLRDAESCAEMLGHYEINFGDFRRGFESLNDIQSITLEQIKNVAAQTFCPHNRCTVFVEPSS